MNHSRSEHGKTDPPATQSSQLSNQKARQTDRHRLGLLAVAYFAAALLFDRLATSIVIGVLAYLFYEIVVRRNRKVIALTISAAASLAAFEYAGRYVLHAQFGRYFDDGADHRLKPNAEMGINSDGIRCPVEHDDFTDETFNIIFLGDSFTYGSLLAFDETMPAQVERLLRERYPQLAARTINFGWISSSPAPSLRLLEDIGAKYKPDLVIQCLDVTDFHDDLWILRKVGYWDRSPTAFLLARLGQMADINIHGMLQELYVSFRLNRFARSRPGTDRPIPAHRFFVVLQPLEQSLPDMNETEHQIRKTHRYCHDVLRAAYILVMLPRHFQYSARESPRNWEKGSYPLLGPYVREPFKWLDALRPRVDFPCHSLLEDFEQTDVFPTCFEHDPHWNADGARVAAEGILRILREEFVLKDDANQSATRPQ